MALCALGASADRRRVETLLADLGLKLEETAP
jgi:hypothetical protein